MKKLKTDDSQADSSEKPKSDQAMRTISEVAQDIDVPQHVLRFWETRFSHVRPMKRANGRRYYRPVDVLLLKKIRDLLYDEGYSIRGVQKLMQSMGMRKFIGLESLKLTAPELDKNEEKAYLPANSSNSTNAHQPLNLHDDIQKIRDLLTHARQELSNS